METQTSFFFDVPIHDKNKAGFKLFGEKQELTDALEPSNVSWENMNVGRKERNCRKCCVFFTILIILCAILAGIIWIKVEGSEIAK